MSYEELYAALIEQKALLDLALRQNEGLNKQVEQLEKEKESLKSELQQLKKLIFGSKQERYIADVSSDQLSLFTEQVVQQSRPATQVMNYERKKTKPHPGREALPDHLPVEEIILEPEGDITNTKIIGKDVSETLKYTPASLVRVLTIRYRRVKIEASAEQKIIQAPLPQRTFPKIIAENSLLAQIIIAKFIDHLPFYRQIQRFKRDYDWKLNKSTLNDWFVAVCTLLEPLYQTMIHKLLASQYIQADESHIKVQDKDKVGATHKGWQWVYHAPVEHIVVFQYRKGRGNNGPKEFLENFTGYLQCDGYKAYDKLGQQPEIHLVGCHVHARRYFVKAKDAGYNQAQQVLSIYQKIYQHEKICKDMEPDQRKAYRIEYTKPLLDQLKQWLDRNAITALPKSPLGKAIHYSLRQWTKLIAVLDNGKLILDNNLIENKIRPLALGRKNYLFAGSHDAAQRIAMMYTFFATCKANNVNPYQWLKYVLDVLPDYKVNNLDALIPHNNMFDHVK